MNLFKKFSDVLRSNLNDWLDKAENPQKLAELALLEAEQSKKKARSLVAQANSLYALQEDGLKQLRTALEKNPQSQELKQKIALCEQSQAQHEHKIKALKQGIYALDQHMSQLKSQAATYAPDIEDGSAFSVFARLEEDIESLENDIKALNEVLLAPAQSDDPTQLEKELAQLKKKLADSDT